MDDRSFKHWITNVAKVTESPEGDFIGDSRLVLKMGRGWEDNSLHEVLTSVRSEMLSRGRWDSNHYGDVEEAAAKCWLRYRDWLAKQS